MYNSFWATCWLLRGTACRGEEVGGALEEALRASVWFAGQRLQMWETLALLGLLRTFPF